MKTYTKSIAGLTYGQFVDELQRLMSDNDLVSYNDIDEFMDRWSEQSWPKTLTRREYLQFMFIFNGLALMAEQLKQRIIVDSKSETTTWRRQDD